MMLRDIAKSENGQIDSTDSRVGVLASEIASSSLLPAFLLNDIDAAYPNRLYSMKVVSLPSAGTLFLDKKGAGQFSGAPAGTYAGNQIIEKFDPNVGLVYSGVGTYEITVEVDMTPVVPKVTGVVITPNSATGSQQFLATVLGTDNPSQQVTWSKVGAGFLDQSGYFTAPAKTSVSQVIAITATSNFDPTMMATVTVVIPPLTIIEEPPEVTGVNVSPGGLSLLGGSSRQFSAVVIGTGNVSQSVIWTIDKGSINTNGVAVMPDAVNGEQLVTVRATSVEDPTKYGEVTVIVQELDGIDPNSIVLAPARTLRTSAEDWSIREGYTHEDGDTFYWSQGYWMIQKDADDILYYGIDLQPYLDSIESGIASVTGLPQGVSMLMQPFARNGVIIMKIGGGDLTDSIDTVNCITLRIACSNLESFDRTIYFGLREN